MRAFLEEYGLVIFVIAVIVLLIAIASPIGTQIKTALTGKVNELASTKLNS